MFYLLLSSLNAEEFAGEECLQRQKIFFIYFPKAFYLLFRYSLLAAEKYILQQEQKTQRH